MEKRQLLLGAFAAGLVLLGRIPALGDDKPPANLGKQVASFTLSDPRDQTRFSLDDCKEKKAVVVIFTGVQCPISNAFLPELARLHRELAPRGVQFLAINSNTQDNPAEVANHAKKNEVPFPVLKDPGNSVADLFGAERTPEAFVLDPTGKVLYRGRIDDQFGIGYQRPGKPTRRDLAVALDEALSGKTISVASTPVAGCRFITAGRGLTPARFGLARDSAPAQLPPQPPLPQTLKSNAYCRLRAVERPPQPPPGKLPEKAPPPKPLRGVRFRRPSKRRVAPRRGQARARTLL